MSITYQKLFDRLKKKKISRHRFRDMTGLAEATVFNLQHGMTVTSEVIERICVALECQPNSIMTIVMEPEEPDSLSDRNA